MAWAFTFYSIYFLDLPIDGADHNFLILKIIWQMSLKLICLFYNYIKLHKLCCNYIFSPHLFNLKYFQCNVKYAYSNSDYSYNGCGR